MSQDFQPNSAFCFVCGVQNPNGLRVRFQNDGVGRVRVETRLRAPFQGYPDIAHGGIVAALMDEVMGRTMLTEDAQRLFYTAKMELRYRNPVPLYQDLVAVGRLLKDKGRAATAEGELYLPDGSLAIEGTATLFAVEAQELAQMTSQHELGWRVYAEDEIQALEARFAQL